MTPEARVQDELIRALSVQKGLSKSEATQKACDSISRFDDKCARTGKPLPLPGANADTRTWNAYLVKLARYVARSHKIDVDAICGHLENSQQ